MTTDRTDAGEATVAVAQVTSERDPDSNLALAVRFTAEAADAGAAMIVFPEYFMSWGPGRHGREEMMAVAQPLTGPFVSRLKDLARKRSIWIVAGVFESPAADGDRPFNT